MSGAGSSGATRSLPCDYGQPILWKVSTAQYFQLAATDTGLRYAQWNTSTGASPRRGTGVKSRCDVFEWVKLDFDGDGRLDFDGESGVES